MKLDILTLDLSKIGDLELNNDIFSIEVRRHVLHRMVNWQRAKSRSGTHKVKEKSEISATTKKFVRQKGSGGARHGSRKAVQFRGGGIVHGPRVRNHSHNLTKKFRKLALKMAFSSKIENSQLFILDSIQYSNTKTKNLFSIFQKMGWNSALILKDTENNDDFIRAARNIPHIDVLPQIGANVYDILHHDKLIITKSAVIALEARLS
jgi:large subunit ribosomal protein L4